MIKNDRNRRLGAIKGKRGSGSSKERIFFGCLAESTVVAIAIVLMMIGIAVMIYGFSRDRDSFRNSIQIK